MKINRRRCLKAASQSAVYQKSCVEKKNFVLIDEAKISCCQGKAYSEKNNTNELSEKLLIENNFLKQLLKEVEEKNELFKENNLIVKENNVLLQEKLNGPQVITTKIQKL
ncbi:hypothetical protein TcasGA2_TC004327 [Tribolium castaneum]|uniref:Uncharacterized protein n=1 Tax=Tribolium castaneum TaxID=7070 RepID=D7EKZ6_TRICA|nr:hypothetical protein TcasGA2_TC004327 [Tribolium castaneum]